MGSLGLFFLSQIVSEKSLEAKIALLCLGVGKNGENTVQFVVCGLPGL